MLKFSLICRPRLVTKCPKLPCFENITKETLFRISLSVSGANKLSSTNIPEVIITNLSNNQSIIVGWFLLRKYISLLQFISDDNT